MAQLGDYVKGFEAGRDDALAGKPWADNSSKSMFYRDGYAVGYRENEK